MKGQSREIIELTLLITGIIIVLMLSYFLITSSTMPKRNLQIEEHQYERLVEVSKNLLYTKIPEVDKTLGQILGDRILQDEEMIFYGRGYGSLDTKKIVEEYFTNYFNKNWKFELTLKIKNNYILWIPNSREGNSISKVNSFDANEIGRYYTVPGEVSGNPSRVALDKKGNVWIGNRDTRTLIKIGLLENNQCIDKNNNGIIETSRDSNMNGVIDINEILPFKQDECFLLEVSLGDGDKYENFNNEGVRAVCIDKNDNVYAGIYREKRLYYVDGNNGNILHIKDLPSSPYGCFVDDNGIVWISTATENLLRYDPTTDSVTSSRYNECIVYGIAPCFNEDCLVVSCWNRNRLLKIDTNTLIRIFSESTGDLTDGRGIIVDKDNNIYTVFSRNNVLVKYNKNGKELQQTSTCETPRGVGIDFFGKVWVACADSYIIRYDSNLNPEKSNAFGTDHYVYNYFTSYDIEINEIERKITYGYDFDDVSRVRTYNIPIPVPGEIGRYADGVLYVW